MATTDYHGWSVPDGTDNPFVHLDIKTLGDDIDKDVPILVTNIAARDALDPLLNLKAIVVSEDYQLYIHNGTTWVAAYGKGAKGLVSQGVATAGSGGFTGLTVVNNIPTFTFEGGRRYEIIWDGHHQSSTANDIIDMSIASCAVGDSASATTGLTVLRRKYYTCHGAGTMEPDLTRAPIYFASDTAKQIKFCGQRNSGAGTVSASATSEATILYQIMDLGALI